MRDVTDDDIVIATAALLGGVPVYYDYGHPERAGSRMYWTIGLWTPERQCYGPTVYGHSRAHCAKRWLAECHPEVKLPRR